MNLRTSILVLATFATAITSAFATPQVEMRTYNSGAGGNYRANPNAELEWVIGNYAAGATDGTWFGTFCIEKNEYFSNGGTYDVALNDRALSGGLSQVNSADKFDVISQGTAFLYTQFATGNLSASYYGNSARAADLQNLIWYLEGEQESWGAGTYNYLLSDLYGAGWDVIAKQNYTGSSVKVMNLTLDRGLTNNQDQLVYVGVPDGGTSAVLLGLGFLGLAMINRKKR